MVVFEDCIFKGADLSLSTAVTAYMTVNKKFNEEALKAMDRFFAQDWGDVCESEALSNDFRIKRHMDKVRGLYASCKGPIEVSVWGVYPGTFNAYQYDTVEVMLLREAEMYNEVD